MPQLNSATFISQIFWLIVSFSLMWLIVGRFIVPKIGDVKERRQHKINDYLAAADEFKQSAEELVARYNTAIEKAEKAADESWKQARSELAKQSEQLQNEMSERLKERLKNSEDELNKSKVDVEAQVDAIAERLAVKIAEKLQLPEISEAQILSASKEEGGKNV